MRLDAIQHSLKIVFVSTQSLEESTQLQKVWPRFLAGYPLNRVHFHMRGEGRVFIVSEASVDSHGLPKIVAHLIPLRLGKCALDPSRASRWHDNELMLALNVCDLPKIAHDRAVGNTLEPGWRTLDFAPMPNDGLASNLKLVV